MRPRFPIVLHVAVAYTSKPKVEVTKAVDCRHTECSILSPTAPSLLKRSTATNGNFSQLIPRNFLVVAYSTEQRKSIDSPLALSAQGTAATTSTRFTCGALLAGARALTGVTDGQWQISCAFDTESTLEHHWCALPRVCAATQISQNRQRMGSHHVHTRGRTLRLTLDRMITQSRIFALIGSKTKVAVEEPSTNTRRETVGFALSVHHSQ